MESNIQLLIEWVNKSNDSCCDHSNITGVEEGICGLIDLRNNEEYIKGHFKNSTNVPFNELDQRMFELPPRASNIGIVYNGGGDGSDGITIEQIEKVLSNYKLKFIIPQSDIKANQQLSSIQNEQGSNSRMLWKASLYLNNNIDIIESTLKETNRGNGNDDRTIFNAIDIACGSGRDCLFLATRKCWKVVGVDNDPILLNKLIDASSRFNIDNDNDEDNTLVTALPIELEPTCLPNENEEDKCYQLLSQLLLPLKNINNNNNNHSGYDLVHVARYLHRPLFKTIKSLIAPGGFILYSTFMTPSNGKPKRPRFLLNPNELKEIFNDFTIVNYQETHLDDGRPFQVLLARAPLSKINND